MQSVYSPQNTSWLTQLVRCIFLAWRYIIFYDRRNVIICTFSVPLNTSTAHFLFDRGLPVECCRCYRWIGAIPCENCFKVREHHLSYSSSISAVHVLRYSIKPDNECLIQRHSQRITHSYIGWAAIVDYTRNDIDMRYFITQTFTTAFILKVKSFENVFVLTSHRIGQSRFSRCNSNPQA